MPSPFPGMDPYLESPIWWHNLHNQLISDIYITLNTLLPANYFALMDERLYIAESEHPIVPDVTVLERRTTPAIKHDTHQPTFGTSVSVLDPPLLIHLDQQQEREVFVEIRRQKADSAEGSEVVTSIELLSPANKAAGAGREAYLQKQTDVIESHVHLLEIDLIRAGRSPLLPTREQLTRRMPYDYAVSLHRAGAGNEFAVWLRTIRQPLPRTVFVPLAADDADILLNLQEIFERCYDIGRYVSNVDYSVPPTPPLNTEDDAWAQALLREKGLRA